MPRKKKPDTTETNGSGTQEGKQSSREAVLQLVDKLEREIGGTEADAAYTPGTTEVYGTFINFLKSYAGDDLGNITEEGTREAWEKAFQILSKFVEHLTAQSSSGTAAFKDTVRAKYEEIEEAGAALFGEAPRISVTGKQVQEVGFPVDKVNSTVWRLLEKDLKGQLSWFAGGERVEIAAESKRDREKKQLNIYYSIDFDALDNSVRITRKLEAYDKRVYVAIGALWAAGNHTITLRQIYYAMGGEGVPAPIQLKKIDEAVTKMAAAHIFINNEQEAQAYNYPEVTYDAALLPMERIKATVNGNDVVSAIHLFIEPPLISFARGRKQITQIKRQLLITPLSWTNQNLALEDYLLECIAHAKRGKRSSRMLYTTIYEETRISEKKQKQRTQEKIKAILDYYKQCGHIKGYKADSQGITIEI